MKKLLLIFIFSISLSANIISDGIEFLVDSTKEMGTDSKEYISEKSEDTMDKAEDASDEILKSAGALSDDVVNYVKEVNVSKIKSYFSF
jgi:hypothetical protein